MYYPNSEMRKSMKYLKIAGSIVAAIFFMFFMAQGGGSSGNDSGKSSVSVPNVGSVYKTIATGYDSSFAIKSDGSLWTWGNNSSGQLGDGTKTDRRIPIKIMDSAVSIAASNRHLLTIKTDSSLWAWGDNRYDSCRTYGAPHLG
jgi:alpha-tubulin suppressor-like RCC1 family protein